MSALPRLPNVRHGRLGAGLRASFEADRRFRLTATTAILALLSAAVLLFAPPSVVSYEAGEVADRDIRAPRTVNFFSAILTREARDRAAAAVAPVYRRDPAVVSQQTSALNASIGRVAQARSEPGLEPNARSSTIQRELGTPEATQAALDMPQEEWNPLAKDLPDMLRSVLAQEVRIDDLQQVRADAAKALPTGWSVRQRSVAAALFPKFIAPNSTFEAQATERAREEARDRTAPAYVQVRGGEIVVREGQVVSEQDVEMLQALGLVNPGVDWKGALGLALWALLIAAMFTLYLERFQLEVWRDTRRVALTMAALLVTIAVSRALIPGHALAVYLIPFAAMGMTLSVLLGGRTALATQTAAALHVGIMSGGVTLLAYVLLPAFLGMVAVRREMGVRDFLFATVFVAAGNLGVLASSLLVGQGTDVLGLVQLFAAGAGNAVVSAGLAFIGIGVVGHLARITTVFELRELADPNHPLLRQLLLRTPGTYHHSLLVANLAERAAEVVGADPLIARVGSYYHDIGKMRNPAAFIENQGGGENPHDGLDPLVSAQIVAAHVRDGIELAARYRLPDQIREVIPGHHGTAAVKFFFQKAQEKGGEPDPEQYRYPGPRPRSREAGIVMLADGVEASVRSLPRKTEDEIRRMVEKISGERVAEGQLDECELTLAEIHRIKDAFVELLLGVYHERIPYPEDRIHQLPTARDERAQQR